MKQTASKTLSEVWDAKRMVGDETRHLRGAEYFRYMRAEAARAFPGISHRKLGATALRVAEDRPAYGKKD
jgi:hypothetical protein